MNVDVALSYFLDTRITVQLIIYPIGICFLEHKTFHILSLPFCDMILLCFFSSGTRKIIATLCLYYYLQGGYYHGKLVFPREFPFKPPSIYMLTPNGRFNIGTRYGRIP